MAAPSPFAPPPDPRIALARRLRRRMTVPERVCWSRLRNGKLDDLKFRRQHPLGPYVADFYCHEAGVVVELDGDAHLGRHDHDRARDTWMRERGLLVLRFSVSEFTKNIDGVLRTISMKSRQRIRENTATRRGNGEKREGGGAPHPALSPQSRGEGADRPIISEHP